MSSVVWVLNNGSYEVSSINHLRCIAAAGSGFTTSGSVPSNFMSANYIQTANIDCSAYAGSMIPIGSNTTQFTGNYNGQNYEIQNWQNNQASTSDYQGIFGYINNVSSIIKNIKITGLVKIKGGTFCGILVGIAYNIIVSNITLNLSLNSIVNGTDGIGGLIGGLASLNTVCIEKIRMNGFLNINSSSATSSATGGILGYVNNSGGTMIIRDHIISINGNITSSGRYIGGIIGWFRYNNNGTVIGLINEMRGNISGTSPVGGLFGQCDTTYSSTKNKMTGQIAGTTWNLANDTSVWTYTYTDQLSVSNTISSTDSQFTYIYWERDSSNNYIVSSINHLRCIALNGGSIFSINGTAPSYYMSASYIQTADIDCSGITMTPIGTITTAFTGYYNGQNYEIQNWQNDQASNTDNQGIFGNVIGTVYNKSTIKNIIISGLCKLKGRDSGGLLIGNLNYGVVNNINMNLSLNSTINCTYRNFGGLIGYVNNSYIEKIRMKGYMTITATNLFVGGVIGNVNELTTIRDIILSTTGNITSTSSGVGGIIGYASGSTINVYGLINEMIGNISGATSIGGILGGSSSPIRVSINKMKGNINGTGGYIGGIVGTVSSIAEDNINIMEGNITYGDITTCGCLGSIQSSTATIKRNIIAIKGNAPAILSYILPTTLTNVLNNVYSNKFGMTINNTVVTSNNGTALYYDTLNSYPTTYLSASSYLTGWDIARTVPKWTYTYTDQLSVSNTILSTDTANTVDISWTQDANSNYIVSSINHLICIAAAGSGFTTRGSVPSNFMSANYIQTVNIDCTGVTMTPIGTSTTAFTGRYDGQNYEIQNWQNYQNSTDSDQGIFGYINNASTIIKNITITGLTKLIGNEYCGILIGKLNSGQVYNINTNFNSGSLISSTNYCGGLIGYINTTSTIQKIRVNGYLNITGSGGYVGGVIGNIIANTGVMNIQDIIISTIGNINGSGGFTGGVIGCTNSGNFVSTFLINAITGNITGNGGSYIGGVVGYVTGNMSSTVNKMKGNLTGNSYVGGIVGSCTNSITDNINIMEGDINYTTVTYTGAIGYYNNQTSPTIQRNVIAMKGNTPAIICYTMPSTLTNVIKNVYSNRFGLTVGGSTVTSDNRAIYDTLDIYPTTYLSSSTYIKYWSDTKKIPVMTYTYTDITSANQTVNSDTPDNLVWVESLNSPGSYEVSSLNHLRCIMLKGVGFFTSGSVPSDFMTASYIQTSNIDCSGYTMIPIGSDTIPFTGSYNGQNYEIQNWQNDQNTTSAYQGIFGYVRTNLTIKNITISGLTKLKSAGSCGILIGYLYSGFINNINMNLTLNSEIICTTGGQCGGLIGYCAGNSPSVIQKIRINGYLTITSGSSNTGGILGSCAFSSVLKDVVYSVTGSIYASNDNVGGIIGIANGISVTGVINEMIGNITSANSYVGGICGSSDAIISSTINKMKGNLTADYHVGGIVGITSNDLQDNINVMEGNIVYTSSINFCGGIGRSTQTTPVILRNILAMKGNTPAILCYTAPSPRTKVLNNVYSNRFGMTVNNATVTTSSGTAWYYSTLDSFPTTELTKLGTIKFWNPSKNIPVWSYVYIDNLNAMNVISSDSYDTSDNSNVTWVLSNGKYNVSSVDHLNCIASLGIGYNSSGSVPPNFMSASYIQTTNIDCNGITMNPIGTNTIPFTGNYDGQNYEIQNWQNNQNSTDNNQGIFGYIYNENTIIKNINITGVAKVTGSIACGLLIGTLYTGKVNNINTNLSDNSIVNSSGQCCGGLIGYIYTNTYIKKIRMNGYLTINNTYNYTGGVIGYCHLTSFIIQDIIISTNGNINGNGYVGGIIGNIGVTNPTDAILGGLINQIIGNIVNTGNYSGGIIGRSLSGIYSTINKMKGDITGAGYIGGIIGGSSSLIADNINIMEGNIIYTNITYCGAIGNSSTNSYKRNIVAIKGDTPATLCYTVSSTTNVINNIFSNKFSMTVGGSVLTTSSAANGTYNTLDTFPTTDLTLYGSIKYWNSAVGIPIWLYGYLDQLNVYNIINSYPETKLETFINIDWSQDSNGNYIVSSSLHLQCIMNLGIGFYETGSYPSNYMGVNYIQIANIDCSGIIMKPIGNFSTPFTGIYDGQNYEIQNWQNDQTSLNTYDNQGIFGYVGLVNTSSIIKNIRITGLTKIKGINQCGSIIGYLNQGTVNNINTNYTSGSIISSTGTSTGGLIGYINTSSYVEKIRMRGYLNITSTTDYIGGVIGNCVNNGIVVQDIILSITGNITTVSGNYIGGIIGFCQSSNTRNGLINEMVGDITSTNGNYMGGIIASTASNVYMCVNRMKGNISARTYIGGIVGITSKAVEDNINIMEGNIIHSVSTNVGGIIGRPTMNNASIKRNVLGMKGNVYAILTGYMPPTTTNVINNVYSNKFGLTINNSIITSGGTAYYYVTLDSYPTTELTTLGNFKTFDSAKNIPVWSYTYTDQLSISNTIISTDTFYPVINWSQDSNGNYIVSNINHLRCLASMGSGLNISGTSPSNYFSSSYIQTTNIDCSGFIMKPISDSNYPFTGNYNGQSYEIQNWQNDQNSTDSNQGIFGYVNNANTMIKNITITGLTKVNGGSNCGSLIGRLNGKVNNINTNFGLGSIINVTNSYCGGLIGYGDSSINYIEKIRMKGYLNITSSSSHIGGVIGSYGGAIQDVILSINGDINCTGDFTGGLIGRATSTAIIKYLVNEITGNINCSSSYTGGIIGSSSSNVTATINRMKGSISGNVYVGGIVGISSGSLIENINIMEGNIVSTTLTGNGAGGALGYTSTTTASYTRNIIAMKGNVLGLLYGSQIGGSNVLNNIYSNKFGMTINNATITTNNGTKWYYDTLTSYPSALLSSSTYLLYWNLSRSLPGFSYTYTDQTSQIRTFTSDYDPKPSSNQNITWIKDTNGNYQVSSVSHLQCIANMGLGYFEIGNYPINYMTASYIQTVNINCTGQVMTPIGNSIIPFVGNYNGNNYEIQNWQNDQISTSSNQGIFGYVNNANTIIKNITLTGLCKVKGASNCGLLVGYLFSGKINNINTNLSINSTVNGVDYSGGLIGIISSSSFVEKIRMKGYLTITCTSNYIGGFIGSCSTGVVIQDIILSTIGNITGGGTVGGIIGITNTSVTINGIINEMIGDINCSGSTVGGIVGYTNSSITSAINKMRGNINGSIIVAGIVGYLFGSVIISDCINIMVGNINYTTITNTGGIYGISSITAPTIRRCVIAMQGNTPAVLCYTGPTSTNLLNNVYSNRFGMTVNNAIITATTNSALNVSLSSYPTIELTTSGTIKTFNTLLCVPVWSYTYTDQLSNSNTITSDTCNGPSLNWVLTNGNYEISSIDHFRCLSNPISYNLTGSYPSNFMTASYIQTANINCNGYTMYPISDNYYTFFTGNYNGQNYEIQNWQNNQTVYIDYQGIFGCLNNINSIIKNINITGLTKVYGKFRCGVLIAYLNGGYINNINTNFSLNSIVSSTGNSCGGLIGEVGDISSYIEKIRIKGYLSVNSTGAYYVGGVIGYCSNYGIIQDIIISTTGNIIGRVSHVGGVIGACYNRIFGLINEITGNISSGSLVGGICGYSASSIICSVNRMKGDLSGNSYIGGLVGQCGNAIEDNINIMEGNITYSIITYCGGIGYTSQTNPSIKRNVLAMRGNTPGILCYTAPTPLTNVLNNVYSNRFGMTINNNVVTTNNGTAWYYITLDSYPTTELTTTGYFKTYDSLKKIPVWTYTYTDRLSVSNTITSTDTFMSQINWAQDSNSNYIVSSINHFLCIASLGSCRNVTGSPPANYLSASYIQTANIDCSGLTMTPIGDFNFKFAGSYNGQNYEIQNWQNNQSSISRYQGIFGYISGSSSIIKNISITGLTKLRGSTSCGILIGVLYTGKVNNINTNFSSGSNIISTTSDAVGICGGLIGFVDSNAYIEKVRINGYLVVSGINSPYIGGVIGYINSSGVAVKDIIISTIGNITTTTNTLGGIIGFINGTSATIYGLINEITGNLAIGTSTSNIGGIIGGNSSGTTLNIYACINRMKGNITGGSYIGGICGGYFATSFEDNIVVMDGNMISPNAAFGIGYINTSNQTFKRNILATTGTVNYALMNDSSITSATNIIGNYYSTKRGMTVANLPNSLYITKADFNFYPTDLNSSVIKIWDSVKYTPNIMYSYTDSLNSTNQVCTLTTNTVILTNQNIVASNLTTTNTSANATLTWDSIPGYTYYRVTINADELTDSIVVTSTTQTTANLSNLICGTKYIGSVFVSNNNFSFIDTGLRVSFTTSDLTTLTITQTNNNTLSCSWSSIPNIIYYRIKVNGIIVINSTAATSVSLNNLTNGIYNIIIEGTTDSFTYNRLISPKTTIIYLTWVLSGSNYIVSTADHLRCIGAKAVGFYTNGSIPTNYLTASYIQTTNVNCSGYTMISIGTNTFPFTGNYNGQNYEIQNWQNDQSSTSDYQGIFGYINGSSVIKNITITGLTKIKGNSYCGILAGYISSTKINNINTNLSSGSLITGGSYIGGIVGYIYNSSYIEKIRIGGYLDINSGNYTGGAIGIVASSNTVRDIISSFIGNITNIGGFGYVGGIIGQCGSTSINYLINEMIGNIIGTSNYIGGIIGDCNTNCYSTLNRMKGNITGAGYVGGIIGLTNSSVEDNINIMEGSISNTYAPYGIYCGGIGYSTILSYKRNILAIKGNIPYLLVHSGLISSSVNISNNVYSNRFGMLVLGSIYSGTTNYILPTDLNYYPKDLSSSGSIDLWDSITNIPYWVGTYTDSIGNTNTICPITTIITTQTLVASNITNTDEYGNVTLTWSAIPGYTYYKILINCEDSGYTTAVNSTTLTSAALSGLVLSSQYVASLYISTDNVTFIDSKLISTFTTGNASTLTITQTVQDSFSCSWLAVTGITYYRVKVLLNNVVISSINSTTSLSGILSSITTSKTYTLTLEGSRDNITFTRLTPVQSKTTGNLFWILTGGNYIVSTIDHLICIGNRGSGYVSYGSVPSDFMTVSVSYIQTANINCTGKTMNPIGSTSNPFYGNYDGQNYEIQNWQNYETTYNNNQGIFGYVNNTNTMIKNIKITGVTKVYGGSEIGILIGRLNSGKVNNIATNLSLGSIVIGNSSNIGGLIGYVHNAVVYIEKIRMNGYLTITSNGNNMTGIGGVIGNCFGNSTNNTVRDIILSTIGNINGGSSINVGGIIGLFGSGDAYIYAFINEMTGNITTTGNYVGGIIGRLYGAIYSTINRIKGDLTGGSYVGGIVGGCTMNIEDNINIMEGSINSSSITGGIGYTLQTNPFIKRNVLAMKGNTLAILHSSTISSLTNVLNNVYSNRFGMTINNTITSSSNGTAWYYDALDSYPTSKLTTSGYIKTFNSIKHSPIWSYTYTDQLSVSQTITSEDTLLPSINWSQDSNGNYIVSSIAHLNYLASLSPLLNVTGTYPSDFMSASYIQTANIDCTGYTMSPIGKASINFNGNYNGQNYEIQNWQNNQSNTSNYQGIFGYISGSSSIIQNISITGVTKLKGADNCGILIGYLVGGAKIYNINTNLSLNSIINTSVGSYCGGLIGNSGNSSYIEKIRMKGYLSITSTSPFIGGVIGFCNGSSVVQDIIISTIGNITGSAGSTIGGIIGYCGGSNTLMGLINEITGNITSTNGSNIGGIIGTNNGSALRCSINRMKGNIAGYGYIGGIVGNTSIDIEDNINIMEGSISYTIITYCGGIGYTSQTNPSIKRNILAMKGNTPAILCYTTPSPLTNVLNNVHSNKFGMTINNATITTNNGTAWYYDTLASYPTTYLSDSPYTTMWDSIKLIPKWTYTYTDQLSASNTILSTDSLFPIINWVQDSNNNYIVSSIDHLRCIALNGSGFNVTGSAPSNFMSASYIQNANIDCTGYVMTPIGNATIVFTGNYNGQNYEIQNWQNDQASTSNYQGFFGNVIGTVSSKSTIKNITISGLCKLKGYDSCGLLIGNLNYGVVNNINMNLSLNSTINCTFRNFGGLIGYVNNSYIEKIRIKGYMTITATNLFVGGVIGYVNELTTIKDIILSTTGNITSTSSGLGGIIGYTLRSTINVYGLINEMIGNISGADSVGGIIGGSASPIRVSINRMKGNINGTSGYIGGIVGTVFSTAEDNINIMEGNITYGDITTCGGFGNIQSSTATIKRNIIAIKGNAPAILSYTVPTTLTNVLNNVYSNKFGMTINGSTITSSNGTAWYYDTLTSYPTTYLSASSYLTGWDTEKTIPKWTYTYTDQLSVSNTILSTDSAYTIAISWTQDSNSNYIVSSINHLRCITLSGSGFTTSGSVPSYMLASYVQTANIDCTGFTMVPIGTNTAPFMGNYNGQNYEIQNWQNNQSVSSTYQGIFGYVSPSSTISIIKNISITGITKVKGSSICGLLIGYLNNGIINNININTNSNSVLTCSNASNGGLIGLINTNSYVEKIRIKGSLPITGTSYIGGVVGNCVGANIVVHDVIQGASGSISGTNYIGGIIGYCQTPNIRTGLINEMTSSITGTGDYVGGLIGYCTSTINSSINKMIGNITGGGFIGGIVGFSSGALFDNINIMKGRVVYTTITYCGGIGYTSMTNPIIKRNVVAVNGSIPYILMNPSLITSTINISNNVYSNRFAMLVNNNVITTSSITNGTYITLSSYPTNELTTTGSIKYWNSYKYIPVWLYSYIDQLGVSQTINSDDSSNSSNSVGLNWVLDNGYYIISSDLHLLTFLQNGTTPMLSSSSITTYTNSGNYPSNWYTANYKQTADIDLNNYNLCSLNLLQSYFSGIYDGQNYAIKNMLYSNTGSIKTMSLFTRVNGGTIKNIVLSGSNNVSGNISYGGLVHTVYNNTLIENCSVLTSGTINITNNFGLICNQTIGSNNIISKCYTQHQGTITTSDFTKSSGIILGQGYNLNNNYVVHCTNDNIGNSYLGYSYGGGIVGKNATVFGCINKSTGNMYCSNNGAGIISYGKAICCINDITGNLLSQNMSGIINSGSADYCMNTMKGNLSINSGYGLSYFANVTNSFNYMRGDVFDPLGGFVSTSSNNYNSMYGRSYKPHNTRYVNCYGNTSFGFSNNLTNMPIRNDPWNIYKTNSNLTYYSGMTLPLLRYDLNINISGSNYTGPSSNWEISFPNNFNNYNDYKYVYNTVNMDYKLYSTSKSNTSTISTTGISDGSTSSNLPYYLLDFVGTSNTNTTSINSYKSNLQTILTTSSSNSSNLLVTLEDAAVYQTLSNQISSSNTFIDFSTFKEPLNNFKDIYKPAIKNALNSIITDTNRKELIKNLDRSYFDTVLKETTTDKLFISSNVDLNTSDLTGLFSNQTELFLPESKLYTINLDGKSLVIDAQQSSASNTINFTFNDTVYTLNDTDSHVEIEYEPGVWKRVELTAIGSASVGIANLTNISFEQDQFDNYLIKSPDEFICFATNGYNYHVNNGPSNLMTANYLQLSNLDFTGVSNITVNNTFSGTYDGNSNNIENLTYSADLSASTLTNFGLFYSTNNATIKNLNLNSNLNVTGSINYGGLVYVASNNTIIENCSITANGSIDISGSLGLICNKTSGSNTIIKHCLSQYVGNISTQDVSGSILSTGSGPSNTTVMYCTNINNGIETHSGSINGGLVGSNATVFGCLNNKFGVWNGTGAGIIGDGTAIACINSMKNNANYLNNVSNSFGGIILNGAADHCVNAMIGSIYGNSNNCGGVSGSNGTINNCLNVMRGDINGFAIGGSNSSNNICGMLGKPMKLEFSTANYGLSNYNLDNSISQLSIIDISNIKTYLQDDTFYSYNYEQDDFKFPNLDSNLQYTVNDTIYTDNAPYWHTLYPNMSGDDLINYFVYAVRYNNSYLVKLRTSKLQEPDLLTIIFDYTTGVQKYSFTFNYDQQVQRETNIGIGITNPLTTLDINGDMNISGDIFNNYNKIDGLWLKESDNSLILNTNKNIGIGTSDASYKLDVEGTLKADSYLISSDYRLKENIRDETLGVDFIETLVPKKFNYINDINKTIKCGLIAQEINNPDFVLEDRNGMLSVNIMSFISPIVKAIQDLENEYNVLLKLVEEKEKVV